jgi:hypothetical protein
MSRIAKVKNGFEPKICVRCNLPFEWRKKWAKNHRMSQQIFGLNRLSDLPELRELAKDVLKGLEKGKI